MQFKGLKAPSASAVFSLRPISSRLASSAILSSLVLPASAIAQQQNNADKAAAEPEKIAVIGSRLSVRTATETLVPVDIIDAKQLVDTGITETARALQFLVPSFNFPTSSVTDGSDAVRPASLRGLSPDHTLVLVNGKRRHGSALVHLNGTMGRGSSNVDLNAIPVSAIKRIEVLRDGAAAQYGSDAIAGVINIVLKDNSEGGEISLNSGQTFEGDGEQYKLSASKGFALGERGFTTVALEYHDKNFTNRAGLDTRQQYPNGDPREATARRDTFRVGDAAYENFAFLVNAGYQLDHGRLYAFADFSNRDTSSAAFFRRPVQTTQNLPEIYPDGFLPKIAPETADRAVTAGYQTELSDWTLDLSANTGTSQYDYYVRDSLNASFGPANATTPTSAYAGQLKNSEQNLKLDASTSIGFIADSELLISTGVSYRHNNYQIKRGDDISWKNYGYKGNAGGFQSFPGFTPESEIDQSRHNTGVFLELENQLTDALNWAAAVRHENYSDFGNNTSWKLAGRYQLTDSLALRAAANNGFRAPSVQQLYFTSISSVVGGNGVITETGTFNNVSPVTKALGQGPLKAETSESISYGLTYQQDALSLTLDGYQIKLEDRVILTSNAVNRASYPIINQLLGNSTAQAVRFFTNGLDTTTKGVEGVLAYQLPEYTWGKLRLSLSAQYNETSIDAVKIPSLLQGLESVLLNYQEQVRQTKANPKVGAALGLNYQLDALTVNLRLNHFGPYTLAHNATNNSGDKEYRGKTLTDLSLSYRWDEQLTLSAGVQNLFDIYPDEQPASVQAVNGGVFKYPNTNAPFGFNGGSYYAEASYRF